MSGPGRKRKPLPKRIVAWLLRLLAARPQGSPRLRPEELRRVLLMRYDKIGDMVITTPLIEALHRIAPQTRIDVLASRANAGLIRDDPRIHHVHLWEKSLFKRIRTILDCRRERYDLTFQLVLWRTTLPGLLAGLLTPHGRIVSRDSAANRELFDYTVVVDASRRYSTQVFAFLAAAVDTGDTPPEMPPYALHIPAPVADEVAGRLRGLGLKKNGFILLNVSAGEPSRELPDAMNVELIGRLRRIGAAHGLGIAAIAAPDDDNRVRSIVREANRHRSPEAVNDVVPLTFESLIAAAACIGYARLIVTPDTGTNHIASAMGRPTVALFTAHGRPGGWGPYGVPYRIVQATEGADASAIRIEEIVEAVEELMVSS